MLQFKKVKILEVQLIELRKNFRRQIQKGRFKRNNNQNKILKFR